METKWGGDETVSRALVQFLSPGQLFRDPMDCSPPGSSVHGISQAGTLEWLAISSSRGSCQPRGHVMAPTMQVNSLALSHLGSPSRAHRDVKKWLRFGLREERMETRQEQMSLKRSDLFYSPPCLRNMTLVSSVACTCKWLTVFKGCCERVPFWMTEHSDWTAPEDA